MTERVFDFSVDTWYPRDACTSLNNYYGEVRDDSRYVYEYDGAFASENVDSTSGLSYYSANVFDSVEVSENVTSKIPTVFINVSDDIEISENIEAIEQPVQSINVFDDSVIN